MGTKIRISISFLIFVIIGVLFIPPGDDEPLIKSIQYDNLDEEENLTNEFSIIESERVFTESNQSIVEQFLDENDLPSSSEKFGIEVQTVLFDSDLTQYPSSSILSIPALELTDSEGKLLDLGSIQTSFLGITSNSVRGDEASFTMQGTVKFYLDDTLITTKKLYSSEQGAISESKTHKLSIVDTIPPSSFDRPQAFTFTLSDEGQGWIDGSEHIYRIVITDINAELKSDENIRTFSWSGEKVAYELKVKLDETKKVVLDENNEALSIFKNDSTIKICGSGEWHQPKYVQYVTYMSHNPTVIIKDTDGNVLADISTPVNPFLNSGLWLLHNFDINTDNRKPSGFEDIDYDPYVVRYPPSSSELKGVTSSSMCSNSVSGIPRDTDIVIELHRESEIKSYTVHTPKSQINYYLEQGVDKRGHYTNGGGWASYDNIEHIETFRSNFGYDSDLEKWN